MSSDQGTVSESTPQEMAAAPPKWRFLALADAQAVTAKLKEKKARKARVAFAGKEQADKRFGVWFLPSNDSKNWQLAEITINLTSDVDTSEVTKIIRGASESTVTFAGQKDKYYVWWLD